MAQWYRLGCLECRLFVDLHKFLPADAWYERFDEGRYDFDLFPGQPSYCAIKVTAAQMLQELAGIDLNSGPEYVRKLGSV